VITSLVGVSFVTGMIMVHYWENKLVRGYYYLSGAGLGLVWYLILAFVAAWIIYYILTGLKIEPNLKLLGVLVLFLATTISLFGLWNAYNPRVKKVTVPIKDLPAVWQNKKVVQLSDVHLGAIYGLRYIERLVKQVNQEEAEMVFITGDLFDGMDGRLDDLGRGVSGLKSKQGTFFVTGNHETYLGVDKTLEAIKSDPIEHLDNRSVSINGLTIVGVDYPIRGSGDSLVERLKTLKFARPAILLYHEPRNVAEVEKLKQVDLMLSGHTHQGQLWPFELIVKAIYGPFAQGLNKINDFYSYTSVGTGTWGPPMRTEGSSEITVITLIKAED